MSGLLAIQVVGGVGPSYTLTVTASAGVVANDHVVAPKLTDSTHGGIYRVTSVPDGGTIVVRDDVKPGGGTYGAPTFGRSAYWTPTAGGLSAAKSNSTPFWGDVTERDFLLLEGGLDTSTKAGRLIPGNFAGNPKKATVTFTAAYLDTNYIVSLAVETINDKTFIPIIENKLAASFDINLSTNNLANLVEVLWGTEPYND